MSTSCPTCGAAISDTHRVQNYKQPKPAPSLEAQGEPLEPQPEPVSHRARLRAATHPKADLRDVERAYRLAVPRRPLPTRPFGSCADARPACHNPPTIAP